MSGKDFFDDDLIQRRDAVPEVRMGPGREAAPPAPPKSEPVPVEDLNLTPLTQRKEEINSHVAGKLDELERLRARQEALEREKASLEQLRANQEKYELGKRQMIDHLEQSLVALERENITVSQRLALLADTDRQFQKLLADMRGLNDEQWPAETTGFREALSRALAVIDNARKEYNKSLARVDVLREAHNGSPDGKPLMYAELLNQPPRRAGFGEWLKIGLAVSLPLILLLLALLGVLVAGMFR